MMGSALQRSVEHWPNILATARIANEPLEMAAIGWC